MSDFYYFENTTYSVVEAGNYILIDSVLGVEKVVSVQKIDSTTNEPVYRMALQRNLSELEINIHPGEETRRRNVVRGSWEPMMRVRAVDAELLSDINKSVATPVAA